MPFFLSLWWFQAPFNDSQSNDAGNLIDSSQRNRGEDGQDNEMDDDYMFCNDWTVIIMSCGWVWLLLFCFLLYLADSCHPGTVWMIFLVTLFFLVFTCGGWPSCHGSFPFVLILASTILVMALTFSMIDRMDTVAHTQGIPWMDSYAQDYCYHHIHHDSHEDDEIIPQEQTEFYSNSFVEPHLMKNKDHQHHHHSFLATSMQE